MDLARAFRLPGSPYVAFVGAGGKSTALFRLARQLSTSKNLPVIVTATTHLHVNQIKEADSHWLAAAPGSLNDLETHLRGVMLVTGPIEADRTTGIDPSTLAWLRELCGYHDLPLLIEADGSRQHPLKAPAEHEPPIPAFVNLVVVVAGLAGIGMSLSSATVHRSEIFSSLSGLPLGESITAGALAQVLVHPQGGLKNIPFAARKVVLLNQADTPELGADASGLAQRLVPPFDSAVIASLRQPEPIHAVVEPVAGIVLAAGEAQRFGEPKQLLDFHGKPFVRRVAGTALAAGLAPVVVVTGAHAEAVESALAGLPVSTSFNNSWQSGQSSSLRKGLEAVPANTGACVFLLADQPQVTPAVITALVERHRRDLPAVVAPMVAGQRANPVLFDRATFPALQALTGDVGGRAIFSRVPPVYIDWLDERLLIDIDTPEDLKKLQDGL